MVDISRENTGRGKMKVNCDEILNKNEKNLKGKDNLKIYSFLCNAESIEKEV